MKRHIGLKRFYAAFILIFLYAPIATLMVLSFNASKSRSHWGGFTLEWYSSLFGDERIMQAFRNTIVIALMHYKLCTEKSTKQKLEQY